MSSWGPGILESDAALDIQEELREQLGLDVARCAPSQVQSHRLAIERGLPPVLPLILAPTAIEDAVTGEKLLRCQLALQPRLSPTARVTMTRVAQRIAQIRAVSPDMLEHIPSYYRAVAAQVVAATLMRFGCQVTPANKQTLLDGMLNCEELSVALDASNEYLQEDETMPVELRRRQREQGLGRLVAVHALHKQFSAYDISGGHAQDLAG